MRDTRSWVIRVPGFCVACRDYFFFRIFFFLAGWADGFGLSCLVAGLPCSCSFSVALGACAGGLAALGHLLFVASRCHGVCSSASYYFGYLRKAPPLVVISSQVRSVIANLLVCIARHLHSFPY